MNETKRGWLVGAVFWLAVILLFVSMKLDSSIDWSWLWVLAPVWGPPTIMFATASVLYVIDFVFSLIIGD